MKKSLIILTLVLSAILSGCKGGNKNQESGPTPEELAQQALADSLMAYLDSLSTCFIESTPTKETMEDIQLSEKEKLVKPDYLYNYTDANSLVTKSQKTVAFAYIIIDNILRKLYDMPTEEADQTIAKLIADINFPVTIDEFKEATIKESMQKIYDSLVERGEVTYFWEFQYAAISEIDYIVANDIEFFFSKTKPENMEEFGVRVGYLMKACTELLKYNSNMSDIIKKSNQEEITAIFDENLTIKEQFIKAKDLLIARRNTLLQ